MRFAPGAALCLAVLANSGCLMVGATVAAVSAVTVVTVKTAGKVTVATVGTTGRVAAAAINSSGEVTALTLESAARLARTGAVVLVDGGSGAIVEMPWNETLQLYQAVQSGGLKGRFNAARIFREGRMYLADLNKSDVAREPLRPGDVVELRH